MKLYNSSLYTKVRILACLETHQNTKVEDIANKLNISTSYTEQMVKGLVKSKLIIGQKGPKGGYRLKESLLSIRLETIITDEYFDPLVEFLLEDYRYTTVHALARYIDMNIDNYRGQ